MNNLIQNKIAGLESKVDQLEAELSYLNDVLIRCGFSEGIETLKATALELLEETEALHKEKL